MRRWLRDGKKLSREEQVTLMQQARAFSEPVVEEFLDLTEERLFMAWQDDSLSEDDLKELRLQCLGLKAFRQFIQEIKINGKQAERELTAKLEKEKKGQ